MTGDLDRRTDVNHAAGSRRTSSQFFSLALIRRFAFIFVYYERTVNFSRVGATNETSLDTGQ